MNTDWKILLALLFLLIYLPFVYLDIRYERARIAQFLRVGGGRVLKFRWKPFAGWMGADSKSKHYEVVFQEHNGRIIQAIFTYTSGVGVMKTGDRILREPPSA